MGDFRFDRKGAGESLKSAAAVAAVSEVARKVQAEVQRRVDDDVEVTVEPYLTDRAAAAVTIADSLGMDMQITDGALTRAAAAVGLEVTTK